MPQFFNLQTGADFPPSLVRGFKGFDAVGRRIGQAEGTTVLPEMKGEGRFREASPDWGSVTK